MSGFGENETEKLGKQIKILTAEAEKTLEYIKTMTVTDMETEASGVRLRLKRLESGFESTAEKLKALAEKHGQDTPEGVRCLQLGAAASLELKWIKDLMEEFKTDTKSVKLSDIMKKKKIEENLKKVLKGDVI